MSEYRSPVAIVVAVSLLTVAVARSDGLAAQTPRAVQVSAGLGVSFSDSGRDGDGTGGGFLIEYVDEWAAWLGGRIYAGGFISGSNTFSCGVQPCAVSSQIGVAGAKIRVLAPIPYVGPFLELGAGVSGGSIETRIGALGPLPTIDEQHSGLMLHVPVTLGLAFGARRQHDVSFKYFAHPGRDHVAGTVSVGIGFTWR